jgi:hypothetical protein
MVLQHICWRVIRGDYCGTIPYDEVATAMQISAVGAFVAGQEAGKRNDASNGRPFLTGGNCRRQIFPQGQRLQAMGAF